MGQYLMVIVNADDFGMNSNVNNGVMYAFSNGYCWSTSIMPNMEGFEEACQLALESRLANRVGLHLNLTEGRPMSDGIRRLTQFCDSNGIFRPSNRGPMLHLSRRAREAVAQEVREQVSACRANGIEISHIDSHNHIHNEWAILKVLLPIAREEKIRHIRASRNIRRRPLPLKMYKSLFNRRLRNAGLIRSEKFGSIPEFSTYVKTSVVRDKWESVELMLHPTVAGDGQVIDSVENVSIESLYEEIRPLVDGSLNLI